MTKVGLIAGSGRFPILFAKEAKDRGVEVIAVAIRGDTSSRLKPHVNKIIWLKICEFNRVSTIFKNEAVDKVVMAGQINPRRLFDKSGDLGPELKGLLDSIKDKKA
jgi:UDP-2,3-diacylglucosamine hydrolase